MPNVRPIAVKASNAAFMRSILSAGGSLLTKCTKSITYVVAGRLNLHVRAFPAPAIELRRIWAHRRTQLVRAESGDSNDLELGTELDECPFLHKLYQQVATTSEQYSQVR